MDPAIIPPRTRQFTLRFGAKVVTDLQQLGLPVDPRNNPHDGSPLRGAAHGEGSARSPSLPPLG